MFLHSRQLRGAQEAYIGFLGSVCHSKLLYALSSSVRAVRHGYSRIAQEEVGLFGNVVVRTAFVGARSEREVVHV